MTSPRDHNPNLKRDFVGHIPGPYGVDLAVYRFPDKQDEFYHDFDTCMDMAGIYHRHDREACRAAYETLKGRGSVPFNIFIDHGGRIIPKEKIGRPESSIYPSLPQKQDADIPVENWVTIVMDAENWRDRASALNGIYATNFEQDGIAGLPQGLVSFGLQLLLTATLEHLHEEEIDCIEAAATYALTVHAEWRDAGIRWLTPFRDTWFRDWIAKNPGYATMAKACCAATPGLPVWISGVRS